LRSTSSARVTLWSSLSLIGLRGRVAHLLSIVDQLNAKGASLRVLNLSIDTGTPTGKLMLTMLGGIAQFEREIMLERQREGMAKAKAEGKYKGRKATALAKEPDVLRLKAEGLGASQIAKRLALGRASVYRILRSDGDRRA
jgi:DNA invertase Pin-like site-specific DNA recombinase